MPSTPWGGLRPGPGVPREVVAADQRERLMAALTVLADERGYASLRVEDLIARAGVSRGAFYDQFRRRDDLLFAAVEEIGALALCEVETAVQGGGSPEVRLRAAVEALIGYATAQPAAARLWLVDAYGAGPAAVRAAGRALDGVAAPVAKALGELAAGGDVPGNGSASTGHTTSSGELPRGLPRTLVGAVHRIVATRLRRRHESELPELARPLADWIAGYRPPPTPLRRPRGQGPAGEARLAPRDQAERLLLGFCESVYDKGYTATTLADVAKAASTSIRTFYAHYYAAEPPLAETVIVEVHAAGEAALRRHEEGLAAIGAARARLRAGARRAGDRPRGGPGRDRRAALRRDPGRRRAEGARDRANRDLPRPLPLRRRRRRGRGRQRERPAAAQAGRLAVSYCQPASSQMGARTVSTRSGAIVTSREPRPATIS